MQDAARLAAMSHKYVNRLKGRLTCHSVKLTTWGAPKPFSRRARERGDLPCILMMQTDVIPRNYRKRANCEATTSRALPPAISTESHSYEMSLNQEMSTIFP